MLSNMWHRLALYVDLGSQSSRAERKDETLPQFHRDSPCHSSHSLNGKPWHVPWLMHIDLHHEAWMLFQLGMFSGEQSGSEAGD
jgi:hypothetical protein